MRLNSPNKEDLDLTQHLVINAIGKDQPGIVNTLSLSIFDAQCNIIDSRMAVLGGEFAIILLVSGSDKAIAALATHLDDAANKLDLTITTKTTSTRQTNETLVPYTIEAIALDHPGIVYQLASFLSNKQINIENLTTESYAAAHTGSPMFAVTMTVGIPAAQKINALRDEFTEFCNELNIDTTFKPAKG